MVTPAPLMPAPPRFCSVAVLPAAGIVIVMAAAAVPMLLAIMSRVPPCRLIVGATVPVVVPTRMLVFTWAVPPVTLNVPATPTVLFVALAPVDVLLPRVKKPPPGPRGELTIRVPPPTVTVLWTLPTVVVPVRCPSTMLVTSNVPVSNCTVLLRALAGTVVPLVIWPTIMALARTSTAWPLKFRVPLAAGVPLLWWLPTVRAARPEPALLRTVRVPVPPANWMVPVDLWVPTKRPLALIVLVPPPRLRTLLAPALLLLPAPTFRLVTVMLLDVLASVTTPLERLPVLFAC